MSLTRRDLIRTVGAAGAVVAVVLVASPVRAQETVRFGDRVWQAAGDVEIGRHLGRDAVMIRSGQLVLSDVSFAHGVVEFDIALSEHRTFPGINFRIDAPNRAAESFYFRPHNSGRFDAVQYTPVFSGISAWQLYPEHNAARDFSWDRWLPVRIDVRGDRLVVTTGADTLIAVDRMRGPRVAGSLSLQSLFPAAADHPDVYPVAFSNVQVTLAAAPAGWPGEPDPRAETTEGFVAAWELSPPFAAPPSADRLPKFAPEEWSAAHPDETGRLNIARYRAIPDGEAAGAVLARVVLRSPRDQTVRLGFGFSDAGSVWLNGRPLFSANNTYRSRSGRYLGVMTSGNDSLFLPLEEGDNELVFMVSEAFGGWGLTARLEEGTDVLALRP